jgi:hypothetical protein
MLTGRMRTLSRALAGAGPAHSFVRDPGAMVELSDAFAVVLALLAAALFAVMIWAGNHTH